MNTHRIEPATAADLEALTDAWVRLASDQRSYGSHIEPEANREIMRATLTAHQIDDGLLVARDDARVVGFVSFSVEHGSLTLDVTRGSISNLFVEPTVREQGIGSALLEAAEAALADRGVDVVTLEAMARNETARAFYRQAGYQPHRIGFERRLSPEKNDTH